MCLENKKCYLLEHWTGYKKGAMRPFTDERILEDLNKVPIQSLSPLPTLMPPISHVPLVPVMMNACSTAFEMPVMHYAF